MATDSAPRGPRASLRQLLPYLFEQRGPLALALVLGVLGAATSLVQPLLLGRVIDRVQLNEPLGALLWLLTALVIADAVLGGLQHYVLQRMGEGVVLASRRSLIARILHLPIGEFDRRRTGDLVSRVGSDTTLLRAVLTQGMVEAASGLLVFAGALIGMLIIDPMLFGITFAVIALALVAVVAVSARIRPAVTRAQEKVGDLAAQVDRSISSIRTIRAAGAAEREQRATEREAEEAYRLGLTVARISAFIVPISFLALQLSFLVVLGLGGYRVATGAIGISQLVMFIVFLFLMVAPLAQAFGAITAVNQALGALGRIQEIAATPTETERDGELSPLGRVLPFDEAMAAVGAGGRGDGAPAIRFADVSFTYRSAAPERVDARALVRGGGRGGRRDAEAAPAEIVETPVLHGVAFEVARGSRVALVGPSGAGKSTILGLIERFYDPDSGSVELYGADLRTLDRRELRAQLGYVEQDAPVLAGSLRDNLRLGAPEASDADCERVLRAVNLGGLLDRSAARFRVTSDLPSGGGIDEPSAGSLAATTDIRDARVLAAALDTQVGERGIMLSGGEKQRLAIARALLTAPPILLLDESTASLDGVNERLMREALDSVATGRTLVVIAHRLSTVIDSDRIVVIDDGRVVGEGTHDELVDAVPLYRELARHQLLVPES